jgi:hypothetical protein
VREHYLIEVGISETIIFGEQVVQVGSAAAPDAENQ